MSGHEQVAADASEARELPRTTQLQLSSQAQLQNHEQLHTSVQQEQQLFCALETQGRALAALTSRLDRLVRTPPPCSLGSRMKRTSACLTPCSRPACSSEGIRGACRMLQC